MIKYFGAFGPQPFTDLFLGLYQGSKAKKYSLKDDEFCLAAKVVAYTLSRIAVAGAIYYGANKYNPDIFRTFLAGAVISSFPGATLFLSARFFVSGLKAIRGSYGAPLTQDFAIQFFKVLVAWPLSWGYKECYRIGLFEMVVFPKVLGKLPSEKELAFPENFLRRLKFSIEGEG